MLNWSQQHFADIRTVTLLWCVQNFIVISRLHLKLEHFKFWSNFKFDQSIVSGMGARSLSLLLWHLLITEWLEPMLHTHTHRNFAQFRAGVACRTWNCQIGKNNGFDFTGTYSYQLWVIAETCIFPLIHDIKWKPYFSVACIWLHFVTITILHIFSCDCNSVK